MGVVKHHGHASGFDQPGKDTQRHATAGADVVIGISPVQVAAFYQVTEAPDVAEMVARLGDGVDLVLTEGFGPRPLSENRDQIGGTAQRQLNARAGGAAGCGKRSGA